MLIIVKQIQEDPTYPEEDIFDILNDDEVNATRKINKE